MHNELVLIQNDLFDIADRLKSINNGYKVYFNKIKQRYEVHNSYQHGDTLAFVVPFDRLDARTVSYALETRVENADKIFEQTEKYNDIVAKSGYGKLSDNR